MNQYEFIHIDRWKLYYIFSNETLVMDYSKLCNELLKSNEKIRYVGVYNSFSGDVYEKMQNGTVRHFDKDQTKKSMTQAIMRWKTRKQFSSEIGDPEIANTK